MLSTHCSIVSGHTVHNAKYTLYQMLSTHST